METIADRYRRLSGAFAAKIDAVPDGGWDAPSPCEDWKAIDIVRHVSETPAIFFGFVGLEAPSVPPVDDDPAAAFAAASGAVLAGLEDPEVAGKEFDGMMGRQTFEGAVDQFLSADLLIHGWDLARAAGLDDRMDPADVERMTQAMAGFDSEKMRGPGAFGPEVEVPADADPQARLLGFLGREP